MGCLSVSILAPTPTDVLLSVVGQNGISGSAECRNVPVYVNTTAMNHAPILGTDCMNAELAIGMLAKNVRPSVAVSLICRVSIKGRWEYLMVEEGDVITIDGQYIKVLKA